MQFYDYLEMTKFVILATLLVAAVVVLGALAAREFFNWYHARARRPMWQVSTSTGPLSTLDTSPEDRALVSSVLPTRGTNVIPLRRTK